MPENTCPKLHNAMWRSVFDWARSEVLLLLFLACGGCGLGAPTAAPGTPEWTIQSASIAARKRDLANYVTHFSPEYQREEIETTLLFMTVQCSLREWAKSEGEASLRQFDAVVARDTAILKLLKTDWDWLTEVDKLEDDQQSKAIAEFVGRLEKPEEVWLDILRKESETPIWWGRIDSVSVKGDTAKAKTYAENRTTFDVVLNLRRINNEWKIDPQDWDEEKDQ